MRTKKNIKTIRCLFSLAIAVQIVNTAISQEKSRKNCFIIYLNTPSGTKISPLVSEEYDIGKMSWMADFGMEMKFKSLFSLSAGAGIGSIKDYNSFTQNTTLGERESTFTTFGYQFKSGIWLPEFPLLKDRDLHVALGTNLGIEDMGGRREIEDCIDCREEKYKFKGGGFVEPELNLFFFQDVFGLGTSYRYYFTDSDLEYKVVLLKLMIRLNTSK